MGRSALTAIAVGAITNVYNIYMKPTSVIDRGRSFLSVALSRSGMFCAIATTIERCKTEGVVDVFQVVKALRVQKPGAVRTVVCFYCSLLFKKKLSVCIIFFRCSTRLYLKQYWFFWTPSTLTLTFSADYYNTTITSAIF